MSGFIAVILLLWLNEVFDLPRRIFGSMKTPVNIMESILETVVITVLAAGVIISTRILLGRIKVLEGLLPICSFCKKIRVDGDWVSMENYVGERSNADFSHTVCPICAAKHYKIVLDSGCPKTT